MEDCRKRRSVDLGSSILTELQQKIPGRILHVQASRCSVKLVELPVVMAPVHSSFFVFPNFSDIFPLLPTDIDHVLQRKVSDL